MQGFQLTFFTQQDHRHRGKTLAHWLVEEARALGIGGATLITASEGFGRHRRIHSAHFIELADSPVEVVMAMSVEEAVLLFARLESEKVELFYIKTPIEFGMTGREEA
ncbi:MAG TPA: DUF190 domain-containing protein [Casimicrobiaceae bacterium]|nr:DUF190 domain-containing protein [Casimicrobiaceae bacterium]